MSEPVGNFSLALILVRFWAVMAGASRDGGAPPPSESAEDALRRRFAEGDVGGEEFERPLNSLRKSR